MIEAVIFGIWGFVLVNILTAQGHILSRINYYLVERLPEWLYKPLLGCSYCVAGQWALWYTIFTEGFALITTIQNVALAVFTVHVIITAENYLTHE